MGILGNAFSGWHLLLILAVILLLFGAAKLPGLAKGIGQSVRILRTESKDPSSASATITSDAPTELANPAAANSTSTRTVI